MKKKLILIGFVFLLMTPGAYSQTMMTGGVTDTATVRLQPDTWVASKVQWVDQVGNIVMFDNGSFIRFTTGGVEQLALVALSEDQFMVVHWVMPDPNGNYMYDRVSLSFKQ